jgi:hypothetical protein
MEEVLTPFQQYRYREEGTLTKKGGKEEKEGEKYERTKEE